MSAYETCYACRGSGCQMGMDGGIADCYVCKGATVIRKRDARGRFAASREGR